MGGPIGGDEGRIAGEAAPNVVIVTHGGSCHVADHPERSARAHFRDIFDLNSRNGVHSHDGVTMRHRVRGVVLHCEGHVLVAVGSPLHLNLLGARAGNDGAAVHAPRVGVVGGVACTLTDCEGVVHLGGTHAYLFEIQRKGIQHQGVVHDNLEGVDGRAASRRGVAGSGGYHGKGAGLGGRAAYRHRSGSEGGIGHASRHTRNGKRAVGVSDFHIADALAQVDCLGGIVRQCHRRQRVHIQLHLLVGEHNIATGDGNGILEIDGGALREVGIRVGE